MLQIKTTGVEDFLDGSANIKALIIGGPGAGKTRMSSYGPKPIFLDCENGRGSLADRNMPYAEIKSSKDMLDALEYLKSLERTPKAQRQFQTVVVDTADSFQRIVKDEWVQQTKAGSFSGFDAWGYLNTKMQLLFTRLLNLDYNVIVLVHYKDKTFKDGENTVRELTLQLQGAIADEVFNDFGLVGWLGTYWDTSEEGRVQKRGLTFQPTPDKPFLKDRFHVTPTWMEINFSDHDYQQIFEAFFNRPEFEELAESAVVGEIPDSEKQQAAAPGPVAPPTEGGPLPPREPVQLPLEKQTKEQLVEVAKGLGLTVKGNALKSEILSAIQAAKAKPVEEQVAKQVADVHEQVLGEPKPEPKADAKPASTENVTTTTTSSGQEQVNTKTGEILTPEQVATKLGAEVIAEEQHDAPDTPQAATPPAPEKPSAPQGPSACADCGGDLSAEWADPTKKDYVRLSFVKFRRYLCGTCRDAAAK
jgi:hypothetical protein